MPPLTVSKVILVDELIHSWGDMVVSILLIHQFSAWFLAREASPHLFH